jgi:predicted dehydrogenase
MALRVALVGMGRIGRVHLQALPAVDTAEVVGVFDVNTQLAHERADAAGVKGVFDSWQDLLRDRTCSASASCCRTTCTAAYATEALAAGKHVVSEAASAHAPECGPDACGRRSLGPQTPARSQPSLYRRG